MRARHLHTGLFLVPWMAVYATSAFCLNDNSWFTPWLGKLQQWELVREVGFADCRAVPPMTLSPAQPSCKMRIVR
jgi:hypothetical protein